MRNRGRSGAERERLRRRAAPLVCRGRDGPPPRVGPRPCGCSGFGSGGSDQATRIRRLGSGAPPASPDSETTLRLTPVSHLATRIRSVISRLGSGHGVSGAGHASRAEARTRIRTRIRRLAPGDSDPVTRIRRLGSGDSDPATRTRIVLYGPDTADQGAPHAQLGPIIRPCRYALAGPGRAGPGRAGPGQTDLKGPGPTGRLALLPLRLACRYNTS